MKLFHGTQTGTQNLSHKNFQIFPSDTDPLQLFFNCQFEAVSRWALDCLLVQYETRKAGAAADFYYRLSLAPDAAAVRGLLFERQVLNYLCGIGTNHTFPIRGLADSNRTTWTYRGPISHTELEKTTFLDKITDVVQYQRPLHLIPKVRNFPAVDSILIDPDDPNAVVTCIQITMTTDHRIAVSGLRLIQSWLGLGTPPAHLRPAKTRRWRFLFVVPSKIESTFRPQNLNGDTKKREWAGKVDQYVLGLEEQAVFGI